MSSGLRPFLHRLFIVLWLLAGLLLLVVSAVAISDIRIQQPYRVKSNEGPASSGATLLPDSVVDAYARGMMTTQEQLEFETDVIAGRTIVPPKYDLTFPKRYSNVGLAGGIVAASACSILVLGALLQYLVLGFASPARLFRGS